MRGGIIHIFYIHFISAATNAVVPVGPSSCFPNAFITNFSLLSHPTSHSVSMITARVWKPGGDLIPI